MSIQDSITNGRLTSNALFPVKSSLPKQYKDRQKRYYEDESSYFLEKMAKYSSDYVEAMAQGLDADNPYKYHKCHIRLSEIVKPSSTLKNNYDNFKNVVFAEREFDYIRKGSKIITMGSTWLVTNPANISGSDANCIIQRCDTCYNYLDYYGNVCTEPLCVERLLMRANDADSQRSSMITKGYFDVKAQYNDVTKNLRTNSRLILGTSAYRVSGFSDFAQEFTGDYSSVNMLEFTVRYEEPNDAIDDMENHVAGGKTFLWTINLQGTPVIRTNGQMQLTPTSIRKTENGSDVVTDTAEHPIDYIWSSSDNAVAAVSSSGLVSGVSEGDAVITCTLEQNRAVSAVYEVSVESTTAEPHIEFIGTIPEEIKMFNEETVEAAYFDNGEKKSYSVEYSFSGADESTYSYERDDNELTIKCWRGSVKPLKVTASYNGEETSCTINLEGI